MRMLLKYYKFKNNYVEFRLHRSRRHHHNWSIGI